MLPKFDFEFMKTNEIKLRSEATSLFDVQRWKFDVRCLFFKSALYGRGENINGKAVY
jgi:hypothetical protein